MQEDVSKTSDIERIQQYFYSIKKDIQWFVLFILFLLIIRSILIEPYRIPSGSMMPTLINGDFILVNKMSYGFKIPFSDIVLSIPLTDKKISLNPIYLYQNQLPKRGDVVVFKYPVDEEINYIKRIIGVPGDEIEIIQKQVYLNGKILSLKATEALELRLKIEKIYKDYNFDLYQAKIGDRTFVYQINRGNFYNLNYKRIKIPEGKYFVLGDNRDFSYDSRAWGFVDFYQIKGKAIAVWFSLTFPSAETYFSFNPSRIGQKI